MLAHTSYMKCTNFIKCAIRTGTDTSTRIHTDTRLERSDVSEVIEENRQNK